MPFLIPLMHIFRRMACKYKNVLGDAKPDYLIIQHMEPDHSAILAYLWRIIQIPQLWQARKHLPS